MGLGTYVGIAIGMFLMTNYAREKVKEEARSSISALKQRAREAIPTVDLDFSRFGRLPAEQIPEGELMTKGLRQMTALFKKCIPTDVKKDISGLYVQDKQDFLDNTIVRSCLRPEKGKIPKGGKDVGWMRKVPSYGGSYGSTVHFITSGIPPKQELQINVEELGKWLATKKKPEYVVIR